jgi:glutathione synthase
MARRIGILMDPIGAINPKKDSSFAMLLEAARRGHELSYIEQGGLSIRDGRAQARARALTVRDTPTDWHTLGPAEPIELGRLDVILARKDPPFDAEYLYDTHVLDLAARAGAWVVNDPQALRDANEKLYAQAFPQCTPPTLVARDQAALRDFVDEVGSAVLKPLDGMAGRGIFKTGRDDPNLNVIVETLTAEGTRLAMAQRFIPEAAAGDKRILLIDGEPVPYALARIPQGRDFRGNMARGGKAVGQPLSERDRWICAEVGPELRRRGLVFVGLDVIGDYLTEINVTSPTGIRELDRQFGINIAGLLFDALEAGLERRGR